MKYKILSHNPSDLPGLVNEHIDEGWRPHGSPTFLPEPNGTILAFQAMILSAPEPPNTRQKESPHKSASR